MTRDCGHSTGDDQRLLDTVTGSLTRDWDIVQEMTRDCGHKDDQRCGDTVQEMTRDCGHVQEMTSRLRIQYRR
ncbi:unnamed protein product [Staurois parvus]|uniref:Uncharacterized protein n=1 Tax=Staurois parvus TaxID=386267 RepID=A0ABN9AUN8_9NEOB|nr:unnamed protein product [Staurois parvus]